VEWKRLDLNLIALIFVEKTTTVKWRSLKNGRFWAVRPGKPPEYVK
jgi:hypothetical protein